MIGKLDHLVIASLQILLMLNGFECIMSPYKMTWLLPEVG